jgi:hypothetical protein
MKIATVTISNLGYNTPVRRKDAGNLRDRVAKTIVRAALKTDRLSENPPLHGNMPAAGEALGQPYMPAPIPLFSI